MHPFLDVDSYKASHFKLYPPGATWAMSYLEARTSNSPDDTNDPIVFVGLQKLLMEALKTTPTEDEVHYAANMFKLHGTDFNLEGWLQIARMGFYPLRIRAVDEGSIIPRGCPLMTVENTHSSFAWLPSWFETQFVRLWYPTNVATISYYVRDLLEYFLLRTGCSLETLPYQSHDFGARGSSVREAAAMAGFAHLCIFKGTDSVPALFLIADYYSDPVAGSSINAGEHSVITMWGVKREKQSYLHAAHQFGHTIFALPCDSYDSEEGVRLLATEVGNIVLNKGGKLMIRPDSGDPVKTVVRTFEIIENSQTMPLEVNSKGFKLLPKHLGVVYGDGINRETIRKILTALTEKGYAASNIVFGMGAALTQRHDRDTNRFAYKTCAAIVDGEFIPVMKQPKTDPSKASKSGRLDLIKLDELWVNGQKEKGPAYITTTELAGNKTLLHNRYENGHFYNLVSIQTIRERLCANS